ncbi:MAG: MFS transporter [Egibacteraceae bacterium]
MSVKSPGRHTHPLTIPSFRWLWSGEALSAVGDQVVPVALAVVALDLGGGPAALGAIFAARVAAMLLFLLPAGILADRFRRTRVMMAADGFRLVVLLVPGQPAGAGTGGGAAGHNVRFGCG